MSDQLTIADIAKLHFEGAFDADQALQRAQTLGLDHIKLAILIGAKMESPQRREEVEAEQPRVWRVTAHGFPKEDGRGKPFPFIWAGRHSWTRDPAGASTHDLTESQWRDAEKKVRKGVLAVMKKERIKDEAPPADADESKSTNRKR